jgi:protein PhnA
MEVRDSNGNILSEGDSVTLIKDLKVKGSSGILKRGTLVKNITLTDNPAEIEGRVNKTEMVLRIIPSLTGKNPALI